MKILLLSSAILLSLAACSDKQQAPVEAEPKTSATPAEVDLGPPPVPEPEAGSASNTMPDAELEAAIRAAVPDYKVDIVSDPSMKSRYMAVRADLNSDGNDEVFVYLMGGMFCGTGGCNLMVFSKGMDGYSLLADIATSRPPIIVTQTQSNGHSDFWRMQSGGGGPTEYVQHSYQSGKYIEKTRVPADPAPAGKEILAASTDFASGTILEPAE
jgi:hypothetical protein